MAAVAVTAVCMAAVAAVVVAHDAQVYSSWQLLQLHGVTVLWQLLQMVLLWPLLM